MQSRQRYDLHDRSSRWIWFGCTTFTISDSIHGILAGCDAISVTDNIGDCHSFYSFDFRNANNDANDDSYSVDVNVSIAGCHCRPCVRRREPRRLDLWWCRRGPRV